MGYAKDYELSACGIARRVQRANTPLAQERKQPTPEDLIDAEKRVLTAKDEFLAAEDTYIEAGAPHTSTRLGGRLWDATRKAKTHYDSAWSHFLSLHGGECPQGWKSIFP